jgi:hypothetical protein
MKLVPELLLVETMQVLFEHIEGLMHLSADRAMKGSLSFYVLGDLLVRVEVEGVFLSLLRNTLLRKGLLFMMAAYELVSISSFCTKRR